MKFPFKRKNLATVILGPVIFFLLLEGSLRIQEPYLNLMARFDISREVLEAMRVYQPHPLWDHSLNPDLRLWIYRGGGEMWFQTNRLGFRHAKEIQIPKPEGLFRVFVLGDSFTEGPAPGRTVSDWIAKRLEGDYPGISFEVINAGVSSESVIPYAVRLRQQIFNLSPNLILVNIDNSDVRDDMELATVTSLDENGIPIKIAQNFERYKQFHDWFYSPLSQSLQTAGQRSHLSRLLWNILIRFQIKILDKGQRWIDQPSEEAHTALFDYIWIMKKELTPIEQRLLKDWEQWIVSIIKLCRQKQLPVYLSTYPHPENFSKESGQHLREVLRRKSMELKIPYFDAYDALSKFKAEDIYIRGDVHYNAYGTQKWGEALGEFVSLQIKPLLEKKSNR